jgi:hypothetical protein
MELCFVAIVKNGMPDVLDTLRSWKPVISSYCICDTGSSDNTMDTIREEFSGVNGYLFQEPFVTFSVSRNRVLEEAEQRFPNHYYVMMDDSCILKKSDTLLAFIKAHPASCYQLRIRNKTLSWVSTRITTKGMRYKYNIHEVVDTKDTPVLIPSCYVLDIENVKRSFDRLDHDLALLDKDYNEDGDKERWLFYKGLHLICHEAKDRHEEGLALLKERAELKSSSTTGLFQSYMRILELSKKDDSSTLSEYIKLAELFPLQREPLFYQAICYQKLQQHVNAINVLEKAIQIPITNQLFFIDVCESYLPQMLVRYYYELGMKSQCLQVIRSVYQYGDPFHLEWEGYKRRLLQIVPKTPYSSDVVVFHPTDPTAPFRYDNMEEYHKCITNYTITHLVVYHDQKQIPYFPNITNIHWIVDDISKGYNTFPVASIVCRDEEHKKQVEQKISPMYHDKLITLEAFRKNPLFEFL